METSGNSGLLIAKDKQPRRVTILADYPGEVRLPLRMQRSLEYVWYQSNWFWHLLLYPCTILPVYE